MKSAETAKLQGSTIGRTTISSGHSFIKYKPKMKKMATKVAREQIFKKPMFLHIKLTGLSDETLGSKIRRAIFRNSSVPVKKSHLRSEVWSFGSRNPYLEIRDFFGVNPLINGINSIFINRIKSLSLSLNWTRLDSSLIWFQNF